MSFLGVIFLSVIPFLLFVLFNFYQKKVQAKVRAEEYEEIAGGNIYKANFHVKKGKVYYKHDVLTKPDPFLKIRLGKVENETKTQKNTLKPDWNEDISFENVTEGAAKNAFVAIWDGDKNLIGTARLNLTQFENKKSLISLPLYIGKDIEEALVELDVELLLVGGKQFEKAQEEAAKAAVRERKFAGPKKDVVISVVSGKIHRSHNIVGKDDAYVKVKIGEATKQTHVVEKTMEPEWNETLYFEGVPEEDVAAVEVSAYDHDFGKSDDFIGSATAPALLQCLNNKTHFTLALKDKEKDEAEVVLEIEVLEVGGVAALKAAEEKARRQTVAAEKAAKEKAKAEAAAAERAVKEKAKAEAAAIEKAKAEERKRKQAGPKKDVVITVVSGKIYHSHNLVGKDDGYVKVTLGEVTKQTHAAEKTVEPEWNETLYFEAIPEEDIADAEVSAYDHDFGKSDDFIGSATNLTLLEKYLNNKTRITLPLKDKEKDEAEVVLEIEVLEVGGATALKAAEDAAKRQTLAAEKAAKEKEKAEAAAAEKAAKEKAKAEAEAVEKAKAEKRKTRQAGPKKDVVITVVSGKILHSHNVIGKDDGYVKVTLGDVTKQTRVAEKTMEPEWNETLYFEDIPEEDVAEAEVSAYDRDFGKSDDFIGSATNLTLLEKYLNNKARVTLPLKDKEKDGAEVVLEIEVLEVGGVKAEKAKEEKAHADHEALLSAKGNKKLTIGVVRGNIFSHDGRDPYVVVQAGKEVKRTQACKATQHPTWNETLTFDHVSDFNAQHVSVQIYSGEGKGKDNAAGATEVDLLNYADVRTHVTLSLYGLKAKDTVVGRIELDLLLEEEDAEGKTHGGRGMNAVEGEIKATVWVNSAELLEKIDSRGVGDPMVKVTIGCNEQSTAAKQNTLTPVWNEKFYFENISISDAQEMKVALWDMDKSKENFKAETTVSLLGTKGKGEKGHVAVMLTDGKKDVARIDVEALLEVAPL